MEIPLERCTRRCAATDRELADGEEIVSALTTGESGFKRLDFSLEGWSGPPDNTVAWWKSKLPSRDKPGKRQAPSEVLLDFFVRLYEQGERPEMQYVLALLLLRRRVLRAEENEETDDTTTLVLFSHRDEVTYRVAEVALVAKQVAQLEAEVDALLHGEPLPEPAQPTTTESESAEDTDDEAAAADIEDSEAVEDETEADEAEEADDEESDD